MNLKCKHTNYYYKKAKCSDPVKTDEQTNVAINNLPGGPKNWSHFVMIFAYFWRILYPTHLLTVFSSVMWNSGVTWWMKTTRTSPVEDLQKLQQKKQCHSDVTEAKTDKKK